MPPPSPLFNLFYGAKNRAPTALGSLPAPSGEMRRDFPEYGGMYDNVYEGETLAQMRKVLEGKITNDKEIETIRDTFNNEFPKEALDSLREDVKKAANYGGMYDGVYEGETLVQMRKVLEGKITDEKEIETIRDTFNNEFPKEALDSLREDIKAADAGQFRANLEGIPEAVGRYSSPDTGEERRFGDWRDTGGNDRFGGNGIYPTANLTNLNMGNDNWRAGGRLGLGIGANTINAGVNIDRTGVIFSDLKASLGFGGGGSAEVGILGRLDDPNRFEGAVNVPVGQGNLSLTGGVDLRGEPEGNSNVGLTYEQPF